MLRSFRLGNHRSFRDEQELLLMPAMPGDERTAVPVAAIYGANASGKSNLLNGLWFVSTAVGDSLHSVLPVDFYCLDSDSEQSPSSYVVEIVADAVRYTYGFIVRGVEVEEEWLYAYPAKRKRVIFERKGLDITFGTTAADLRAKFSALEELIRSDVLLLSNCGQLRLGPLMPVYHWFEQVLTIAPPLAVDDDGDFTQRVGAFVQRSPEHARRLLSLLVAADVGITNVVVEKIQASSKDPASWRRWSADRSRWSVNLAHGPHGVVIRLREESAGTLNWLGFIPTILDALDAGRVLVIDEIDASLHPMLTAKLVSLFQSEETNPNGAQLIFTTHDTSLLGTMLGDSVLDRDQIWFVDKNAEGASELYPLTDFKPRKDQNTERRYLAGSYGAVPVLGDFAEAVLGR